MRYDPARHHRRSIRLQNYDYSWPGAYFVTVLTHRRRRILSRVVDGEVVLTQAGVVVAETWSKLTDFYPNARPDTFVVMPDHFHGIIILRPSCPGLDEPASSVEETSGLRTLQRRVTLGEVVRGFKARVTFAVNELRGVRGVPLWHRNYFERVVRNEDELERIRRYIRNNPRNWSGG